MRKGGMYMSKIIQIQSYKLVALIGVVALCTQLVGCSQISGMLDTVEEQVVQSDESVLTDTTSPVSQEVDAVELEIAFTTVDYDGVNYVENFADADIISYSDGDEIYITESGVYEFSGNYNSSTIVVNVDKDIDEGIVYLLLNGVNITSEDGTPINIIEAKDVVILLVDGTDNYINQGAIVTEDTEFPSAALYSKADTVIGGSGSLTIETAYNDGINGRDDMIIENCTITITSVGDGIVGQDYLACNNVTIDIVAGGDGMKATNVEESDKGSLIIESGTYTIDAQKDGISAANTLQLDGGEFTVASGGGYEDILNSITVGEGSGNTVQPSSQLEYSMKGLKAYNIILNDGTFSISSYEDGIHADNDMEINGGTYSILSGDDAVHADGLLTIHDGEITVEVCYEGIEASTIEINGGTIIVIALDDAVNGGTSDGTVTINGGSCYLYSRGDGLDANGDFIMTGGEIIFETDAIYTGGDSELDVSGSTDIQGGTLVDVDGNDVSTSDSQSQGGMFSSPMQNNRTQRR